MLFQGQKANNFTLDISFSKSNKLPFIKGKTKTAPIDREGRGDLPHHIFYFSISIAMPKSTIQFYDNVNLPTTEREKIFKDKFTPGERVVIKIHFGEP
jgi:hypothetical protein